MYKLHAPKCALPGCDEHVHYHKRYIKDDGILSWKWKTFCEKHRSSIVGKSARQEFFKRRGGCENRDGQLGWTCNDPNTPSLTIDHINGNKHKNVEDNIMVLCANCHNRKTKTSKDYLKRYDDKKNTFDQLFLIEEK